MEPDEYQVLTVTWRSGYAAVCKFDSRVVPTHPVPSRIDPFDGHFLNAEAFHIRFFPGLSLCVR